jgi:hypothetical protein
LSRDFTEIDVTWEPRGSPPLRFGGRQPPAPFPFGLKLTFSSASLSTFQQMWIAKAEYDEGGPSIVHRKCF